MKQTSVAPKIRMVRTHPFKSAVAVLLTLLAVRTVMVSFSTPQPPPALWSEAISKSTAHKSKRLSPTTLTTTNSATKAKGAGDTQVVTYISDNCWTGRKGAVQYAYLGGSAESIGACHAAVFREQMVHGERVMWQLFERYVPTLALRQFIMDFTRIRYARLVMGYGYARRAELGAMARAFQPDPFDDYMPTFARFIMLNALYDVVLSFEHSPLVGCSSVYFAKSTLLGRNFDFEVHDWFDTGKAVIVFAENGKIPVLSVGWPGLMGVVTGMNASGVAAVVHGARASKPTTKGEPVLQTVREALANSATASEAASWIAGKHPMVSHMVLVADSSGESIVVERAPGYDAFLRRSSQNMALSNHLEGPLASDRANKRVIETTSTIARRLRLEALLKQTPQDVNPPHVMAVLRDKNAADASPLPPGDRRAIDADIATHGVVMDLKERKIWVSAGPHLRGEFVPFEIHR